MVTLLAYWNRILEVYGKRYVRLSCKLKSQRQRRAYKKHEARMKRRAERRITMTKSFNMQAVSVCNRPAAHDRTGVQEPIDHDRSVSPVLPTPGSYMTQ